MSSHLQQQQSAVAGSTAQTLPNPLPYRQNAADHIRELSRVNAQIPEILRTSGTAISQLTTRPVIPSPTTPDAPATRKLILQQSTHTLFTAVGSISGALHSQIADLLDAKVIPATQIRYIAPVTRPGQQAVEASRDSESKVTNGGLGDLDVGVLNARAGVRQAGGEEVLDRVRAILETLVEQAQTQTGNEEGGMIVDG